MVIDSKSYLSTEARAFKRYGPQDLHTRVLVTMMSLFAEIVWELISLRTKEALAAARAAGKRLSRLRGTRGL